MSLTDGTLVGRHIFFIGTPGLPYRPGVYNWAESTGGADAKITAPANRILGRRPARFQQATSWKNRREMQYVMTELIFFPYKVYQLHIRLLAYCIKNI